MATDLIEPKYTVFDLGYERCLAKTDSFYDDQGANADKVTDSLPSILIGGGGLIGNITMVDGFMQSFNYVAGSTGWKLTETTAYLPSIDLSGYLLATGGAYKTAASGSRVEIFPDINTGIIAYDSTGTAVFTVLVGGTDEGDVILGSATKYAKWDKSENSFIINGAAISNATLTALQTGSEIAIQGWSSTLAFSSTDYQTVAWGAGTIKLTDGTTFNIVAGNTGNMAAATYIYFSKLTSEIVLQVTTTYSNAVGANKILIAVAQNVADTAKKATYQVFGGGGGVGGTLFTADNIAANVITFNEIAGNTIIANNISTGLYSLIDADFPPDTNLVGYWSFDEGSGSVANDGSNKGNNGTIIGNPTWIAGVKGTAIYFDGTGDYIDCGSLGTFDFNSNFTLSFLVKGEYKENCGIITKTDAGTYYLAKGFSITHISNPYGIYVVIGKGDSTNYLIKKIIDCGAFPGSATPYDWTHISLVRSSNTLTIYVSGAVYDTLDLTGYTDMNGSQSLFFGKGNAGTWAGQLDDVRLYQEALTAKNVYSLYKNPGQGKSLAVPVGRLTSGYIYSKQIQMAITAGTGDSYISFGGKLDFDSTNAGAILGCDDSDSDKFKMYLVNSATKYFYYDGNDIKIKGGTIVAPEFQTADDGTIRMAIKSGTDAVSLKWYSAADAAVMSIKGNVTNDRLEFTVASGGALYWDSNKTLYAPSGTGICGKSDVPWATVYTKRLRVTESVADNTGLILAESRTPASAGADGVAGTICWDASYIYVCTASNTWKRAAISW
jgi:hypothetical protein